MFLLAGTLTSEIKPLIVLFAKQKFLMVCILLVQSF